MHKNGKRMKSCIFLDKINISQKNNKLLLPISNIDKNESREFESSFKMENLVPKHTDSKNIKKEEFFEFYI